MAGVARQSPLRHHIFFQQLLRHHENHKRNDEKVDRRADGFSVKDAVVAQLADVIDMRGDRQSGALNMVISPGL